MDDQHGNETAFVRLWIYNSSPNWHIIVGMFVFALCVCFIVLFFRFLRIKISFKKWGAETQFVY